MRTFRRILRRLVSWSRTRQDEERLRAEIEDHLARQSADNERAGMTPREARWQAALKFGGVEATKESYRDQKGLPFLESLVQDTRYAVRRLRRAPAFTMATILTLALGIGATTAIFTLVHAVLLKSLPVTNPNELYRLGKKSDCCYVGGYSQENEFALVSYDLYRFLKDHTTGFSELAAFPASEPLFGVRRSGSSESAQSYPGEFVSGNYFATFGIGAYAGRVLSGADDRPGASPAAVMSYRLWQDRYAADPSVIGGSFVINDKPFTVVGITPPGFFGDALRPNPPDFFLPLNTEPFVEVDNDLNKYSTHWLDLIGRIRPGVQPSATEAEMRVALKQWLQAHWSEMDSSDRAKFPKQTLYLTPGGAGITGMREQYAHWLQILMMASGLVLLIVCANVANLMLVRGMERRRQTSLSMALGARPARLVRPPLVESIALSLMGGAAGLAIAFAGTRLILRFAFPTMPGLAGVPISPSPSIPVLLFAFLLSLATGVGFGIAPAWIAMRVDPMEALRGTGRSTARAGSSPRKMFVVFQAALSLVLLSAAGLLSNALSSLENQDFGFEPERRIVAAINPRLAGYRTSQLPSLYQGIHDAIAAIPGISGVSLCLYAPLHRGGWGAEVFVEGQPATGPSNENLSSYDRVSASYLEVIGNAVVRGRGISERDTATSPRVAVINEAFARKIFQGQDPIGKRFRSTVDPGRLVEVVGVAKDARYLPYNLDQPIGPFFFLPEAQGDYTQTNMGSLFLNDIVILPRPGATVSAAKLRDAIASVDPNLPLIFVRPLKEQVAVVFNQPRLIARLTSFFGLLSLVLASIGLYGVTAYNAGQRTSEIGVRMALGAATGQIVRLVLRGAFALVLFGLLIGLPLAFAAGRFLESQLYGTSPYNLKVTLAAVLVLGLSALGASIVPAVRASGTSPSTALRVE
ncbi:MAG TPA: ABC transporter permease [Bryobacteraceae bacterium]|nr:ABC transporter permease [Bryobacteraceae bacterium]